MLSRAVPCSLPAVAGLLASQNQRRPISKCHEERPKVSYYGSYLGDRFGGGIGRRVGVDESKKEAIPGTGVVHVALFSESRGRLKEWATEANWKEATRIHKTAYFTRTENLVQEAVIDRIRQHYVSSPEYIDHHQVEASLFRLEDRKMLVSRLKETQVKSIPGIRFGIFDEKREKCVVDFANKRLGGGWLSYGMVQEEKMFAERFDFGALVAKGLVEMPSDPTKEAIACAFSTEPSEAWIMKGAPAFAEIPWYGRTPKDGLQRLHLLPPEDDLETSPTVIAMDAIKADFATYQREHLEMMVSKAYTGFVAAKHNGCTTIATGSWGCGAFYNNERVMFVVQALAANLAGVELIHHVLGDGMRLGPAFAFLEECLVKKRSVEDTLALLVERCASDPKWGSKFNPDKGRGARGKQVQPQVEKKV